MELRLRRIKYGDNGTIGVLEVDSIMSCFTVEDPLHEFKVAGDSCIPVGRYEVKLRTVGGMTKKYAAKYDFHEGMLWLQDVPGFEWVYIHVGNSNKDTEGCILVNEVCDSANMTGGRSRSAYVRLYNDVLSAMKLGESIHLVVE